MVWADPSERWRWAAYAAALLAVWLVYWLAFFPGVFNRDVLGQWRQVRTLQFSNWHPAFHTFTLWFVTRPWRSLGAASLVNMLATAALTGCVLARCRKLGAPPWLVWALIVWMALSPCFALNAIAIWKDTPFALAVLWAVWVLLGLVERRALAPRTGAALGGALALAWLLRHNGPAVALPTLLGAAWYVGRPSRAGVVTAAAVCLGCVALVKGPLYSVLHVARYGPEMVGQTFIHQVAGLLVAGTPLEPEEERELAAMRPLPVWRDLYSCEDGMAELSNAPIHLRRLTPLVSIWGRLAVRNPGALAEHWRCATRWLWSPFHSSLRIGFDGESTVKPNKQGIVPDPWIPALKPMLAGVVRYTFRDQSLLRAIVWQPASSLYVLLGALAVAVWRSRSAAPLVVLMPALCNTLVFLAFPFTPFLRYQWPVLLLTPVALCLAALYWKR